MTRYMYQPAEGAITDRFAFTARLEEEPSVCGVRAAGKRSDRTGRESGGKKTARRSSRGGERRSVTVLETSVTVMRVKHSSALTFPLTLDRQRKAEKVLKGPPQLCHSPRPMLPGLLRLLCFLSALTKTPFPSPVPLLRSHCPPCHLRDRRKEQSGLNRI